MDTTATTAPPRTRYDTTLVPRNGTHQGRFRRRNRALPSDSRLETVTPTAGTNVMPENVALFSAKVLVVIALVVSVISVLALAAWQNTALVGPYAISIVVFWVFGTLYAVPKLILRDLEDAEKRAVRQNGTERR